MAAKAIKSKKNGKQRLVWVDEGLAATPSPSQPNGDHDGSQIEGLRKKIEQLNQDNSQLAASNCQLAAKLEKMIDDAVEASKRHDIIVMRLADQIEAQRLQLEESQQPKPLIARLKSLFMTGS